MSAFEVDDRGRGLAADELPGVAKLDHGSGECGALVGRVDRVKHGVDGLVGGVGVVVFGGFDELFEFGSDEGGKRHDE